MKRGVHAAFDKRKAENSTLKRKRNMDLPAGSPMFYYCYLCGAEMARTETHSGPAPKLCDDCLAEGRQVPRTRL